MKRVVRENVFESNSSSCHALTLTSLDKYNRWKNGELAYERWGDGLVEIDDKIRASMEEDEREYLTYEQFHDWEYMEYETFCKEKKTEHGDTVVAFGYYGHD